jgi:hypothetical protein
LQFFSHWILIHSGMRFRETLRVVILVNSTVMESAYFGLNKALSVIRRNAIAAASSFVSASYDA